MDDTKRQATKEPSLWRIRLDALLRKGIDSPFTFVVASSGYGKSELLQQFTTQEGYLPLWMKLTPMDNYFDHFWQKLVDTLSAIPAPFASDKVFQRPPATLEELDRVVQAIYRVLPKSKHTLLILDDFQYITDERIRTKLFYELDLIHPSFSVVVLSTSPADETVRPACMTQAPVRITAQDLCFTMEEILHYFEQLGIPKAAAGALDIMRLTGGWPFAVDALAQQVAKGIPPDKNWTFDTSSFFDVLQEDYYNGYDADIREMLGKLAILPLFTLDIAVEASSAPLHSITETLQGNPFILADATHAIYTMQTVYVNFLTMTHPLPERLQKETLLIAAGHYMHHGLIFEAVDAYIRTGAYGDAFSAIRGYPLEQMTLQAANQFFDSIYAIPEAYITAHPYLRIYRAILVQYTGKRQQSEAMLTSLLEVYREQPVYLGEVYLALGVLLLHQKPTQALEYVRLATSLLPDGCFFRKGDSLSVTNRSIIRLQAKPTHSLKDMMGIMDEAAVHFSILFRRPHRSLSYLYRTESAFCVLNLTAARKNAYDAMYHASLNGHYGIQCNALFVLMRIAVMSGHLDQAEAHLANICALINDKQLTSLYTLRDSALGWFYIKIKDFANVPLWLKAVDVEDMTSLQPVSERDIILRVAYLLESEDNDRALALAKAYLPYCEANGFWIVRLNLLVSIALLYSKLNDMPAAIQYLYMAYDLAYEDGITLPFVEAGHHMRTLLDKVDGKESTGFDQQWLKTISTRANTYAKRISTIASQYFNHKNEPAATLQASLTKRETEVLGYLSQGLKYNEIADFMGISINGVKKHVMSIYSKLNASNRSDAIRQALQTGLIT